jgi:hypothetical protein
MTANPPATKQGLYMIGERNNPKSYLGDSVYAEWDGYGFCLTTENGYPDDPRNRIYLEPVVLEALDLLRQAIGGYKDLRLWGAKDAAEERAAEYFNLGACADPRHAPVKICRSCFITAVAVELRREQPIRDLLLREL